MIERELVITIRVVHPLPCPEHPFVIAGVLALDGLDYRASATVNCACGAAEVAAVACLEVRRQVRASRKVRA